MDRLYKFWTIGILFLILISSIRCETEPILKSPVVRTNEVTSVGATAISTGGSVTDDGGAPVFARGVCWSINSNPTTNESRTNDGAGTGDYITTISNLQPDTKYYIRSYATNKIGTAYGNQIEITTLGALPVISIIEPSDISSSSFKCGGRITGEGASAVTERGVCWSENSNSSIANSKISSGAGVGEFYVNIDKLIPGRKYFIKAYAVNNHGIAYSSELTINTSPEIPQVKTLDIANVKSTSASGGGEIIKDGGAEISVRGICWSTNQNPSITNSKTTDGAGTGTFISLINGLLPQTTYYVRAYATNSKGTGYGDYKIFTTADAEILFNSKLNYEKIQDIDGNEYKTIKIGTQTWMAENLKVTKLNDGTTLTNEISNQGWSSTSSPAYSLYNNEERSKITYGALYNWASASSGKLCPQGWHIPTDKEWKVLIEYLGGNNSAEAKLKEAGNGHWIASGINESGFTALPGGVRYWDGQFDGLYKFGVFLGSQSSLSSPYYVLLGTRNNLTYYILSHARNGFSVRCIASSVPIVRTTSIIMVANNPVITGNVDDDGGSEVIERGVCWSLNQNPTIEDSKFSNGKGEGMFSCTVYGLLPGKKYYARAYAKNYAGIAYGNQISFETDPVPSLLTNSVYGVTTNSAICSASITDRGGTAILVRGVCWSKEENPTKDDYVIASTDISDNYTCEIYQLSPGTTYYIRAFATNFTGTGYGNLITFKTKSDIPKITTSETTHITSNSAISGGTITSDGGEPVLSRGVCWSQKNNPTVNGNKTNDGAGVGHFISSLSDLNPGEKYYIRAYATNKIGTAYGHEVSFTTQKAIPKLTTKEISSISSNTAISGGNIISTGGAFIMEKGICWNTSDNPTTSHYNTPYFGIDTSFTCTMGGLQPGTVYYVRSYAKNSVGTGYGNSVTFKTKNIVPQPTIQPAGGKYFEAQKVSISCSVKEAEIRYTTDGTNPNESSSLYKSEITVDKNMTIKARAYKAGWIESSVITESYTIENIGEVITGTSASVQKLEVNGDFVFKLNNLTNKDVYFIFTNSNSSSTKLLPTVKQNFVKSNIYEISTNFPAKGDLKLFDRDISLETLNPDKFDFVGLNDEEYNKYLRTKANTYQIGSEEFFYDRSTKSTKQSTLRKILKNQDLTINIWVDNSCWGPSSKKMFKLTQNILDEYANAISKQGENNDIFDWVRNFAGEPWSNFQDKSLIKYNNEINIWLTDIDDNNNVQGGIAGYYWWPNNYLKSRYSKSNEKLMLVIDALLLSYYTGDTWEITDLPAQHIILTTAHELSHMIYYHEKVIKHNLNPEVKELTEMLALCTEDLVAYLAKNNGGPRGVNYDIPNQGNPTRNLNRLEYYNNTNYFTLFKWDENDKDKSYSTQYALGAYLMRNYGGVNVIKHMMQNQYIDFNSVVSAVNANGGQGLKAGEILRNFAIANLLSDDTSAGSPYKFNTGTWFTSVMNGVTYKIGSINLFKYQPQPYVYNNLPFNQQPFSNLFYLAGSNLSGQKEWYISNLNEDIKITVVIK